MQVRSVLFISRFGFKFWTNLSFDFGLWVKSTEMNRTEQKYNSCAFLILTLHFKADHVLHVRALPNQSKSPQLKVEFNSHVSLSLNVSLSAIHGGVAPLSPTMALHRSEGLSLSLISHLGPTPNLIAYVLLSHIINKKTYLLLSHIINRKT